MYVTNLEHANCHESIKPDNLKMIFTVSMTEEGFSPSVDTYVLVVDDHPFFAGGLVGAQVLVNTPVAAPSAQDATATTVCAGKDRERQLERRKDRGWE